MAEARAKTSANPFVGPRSFRLREACFYGRQREIRELVNLITAERLVLMHSPAGAGKSSLIQAGIIPVLERTFEILPVIRVGRQVELSDSVNTATVNRYVLSTLLSLEHETGMESKQLNLPELAQRRLAECVQRRGANSQGRRKPQLLIFDQFEEILTIDPYDRSEKVEFFRQLAELLHRDRDLSDEEASSERLLPRWALFSMRDEYVAALDPYLRLLPMPLGATYRLDPLTPEAAQEAIQKPAEANGITFSDGAAGRLVDNLRRVQVQTAAGSSASSGVHSAHSELGPFVEPVQMQVVCYRLWERLQEEKIALVEPSHIDRLADVDNALAGYYADKVGEVARKSGVPELEIRDWFEKNLITPQNLRAIVQENVGLTLHKDVINELVNAYLVRREAHRGLSWLELSHDRLVDPVRRDNERWMVAHLSPMQLQARQWLRQGKPDTLLLRRIALLDAETWARQHAELMTRPDHEFLQACQRHSSLTDQLKSVMYRFALVTAALLVFAVVSAIHAWRQSARAEQESIWAKKESAFASEASHQANAALGLAVEAQDKALEQAKLARHSVENNLKLYHEVCLAAAKVVSTPDIESAKVELNKFNRGLDAGEYTPIIRSLSIARTLRDLLDTLDPAKARSETGLVKETVGEASLELVRAAIETWRENLKKTTAPAGDSSKVQEVQKQVMRDLLLETLCERATNVTQKIAAAPSLDKAKPFFPELERLYWAELYWIEIDEKEWRARSKDPITSSTLENAMVVFRERLKRHYALSLDERPHAEQEEIDRFKNLTDCANHVKTACDGLLQRHRKESRNE
jgi:hypothetical protein